MAMAMHLVAGLVVALLLARNASAVTLALYNRCGETVWPGIQPSAGKEILARGGLQLAPSHATSLRLPLGWSGRVWGRQGCSFDAAGRGSCATGDCGGNLYRNGAGGAPPATLAEITLASAPTAQDFYDVSLVDGYNIPIAMTPFHGSGANCVSAGCVSDLNRVCPTGLAVRGGGDNRVVGCRSACVAYGAPQYSCTGQFGSPQQCKPTSYSRLFKSATGPWSPPWRRRPGQGAPHGGGSGEHWREEERKKMALVLVPAEAPGRIEEWQASMCFTHVTS